MPEGDTLYKAAARLRVMVGQTVTRFESTVLAVEAVGRVISAVEARGKNLLIWFTGSTGVRPEGSTGVRPEGTHALYTHLRMEGSWHLMRPGSAWRRPSSRMRVLVETEQWVAICFSAPVVEWLTAWEVAHHPVLAGLGPDLLSDDEDPEAQISAILARLRVNPERPLGEAILDQRLVAGLGNVYKSELLFLERLDPFMPVAAYDDEALRRLLAAGRTWMRRNVMDGPRQTRWDAGRAKVYVYNRSGELCPRCNTPIEMRRQGALGRSTYYCPQCQQVGASKGGRGGGRGGGGGRGRGRGRVMVRGPAQ